MSADDLDALFDLFAALVVEKSLVPAPKIPNKIKMVLGRTLTKRYSSANDTLSRRELCWLDYWKEVRTLVPKRIPKNVFHDEDGRSVKNLLDKWRPETSQNPEPAFASYFFTHVANDNSLKVAATDIDRAILGAPFEDIFGEAFPVDVSGARMLLDAVRAQAGEFFLPDPHRTDIHSFAYAGENKIPVLGRNAEVAALRRFLEDDAPFLWLQLAGDAGQGKSRLAWDLIQEARQDHGWRGGFWSVPTAPMENQKTQAFVSYWDTWKPERPHLFVVDYVVATGPALGVALQTFMERSEAYDHPVRVLLLERQAWNRGGLLILPGIGPTDEVRHKTVQSRNRAAWFDALDAVADRRDLADPAFMFASADRQGVITLEALSPNHLVKIARDVFKARSRGQDLAASDGEIKSTLSRVDGEGRPLYPYFLGQAMADGNFQSGWTRDDLLNNVITRDQRKRWSAIYDGAPPSFLSDDPAMICAVLATMAGGLRIEDFVEIPDVTISEEVFRKTLILVNGPDEATVLGPAEIAPPLLPDLLGEWFVFKFLSRRKRSFQERLIHLAWTLSPFGMAQFIVRASADFPYSTVLKTILRNPPCEEHQNGWYIAAIKSIFLKLLNLFGEAGHIDAARDHYDRLAVLTHTHDEPELRELQATAAFNLVFFYQFAHDITNARAFYDALAGIARNHAQPKILELQAMSAGNLIMEYCEAGDIAAADALYDALADLTRSHDQPELREEQAAAALNLILYHGEAGDIAAAHAVYDGLVDLARVHDQSELREAQAKAAAALIAFHRRAGNIAAAWPLYDGLVDLARAQDQSEITELQTEAAFNIAMYYINAGDIAAASIFFDQIANLPSTHYHPEMPDLKVAVAEAISAGIWSQH